jgi:GNAT superfamily N-acetyltransferase
MSRTDLCARLLTALAERAPQITAIELADHLRDWELIDAAGAVIMRRGAEMHVAAIPEIRGRWFGSRVRELLRETLEQHGRIDTVVMKDHHIGHAFALRMGFEQVGESGAVIRYELRKLRHAKSHRTA